MFNEAKVQIEEIVYKEKKRREKRELMILKKNTKQKY